MGKEPYGVEQCAEYFDKNCEKWAKNPTGKINLLLENNRKVVMKALSCGYLGLVMATGMMKMHEIGNKTVKSYFLERRHPTYFGMMVSYYELQ
jgi:aromatic ring-opening dioxygenase LigB subunit